MYILFGGGPLLLEFVKRLKKKGLPVFVVTSERHANESVASGENVMSFRDALEKEKIDYIVTVDINTERVIKKGITSETLGMSFGAAWIFRKSFISRFNGRLINAHGTRLPMDRGGGGFSWRIMRGDRKGCSLLHLVDAGIDTGNIVRRKEYTFPASCRVPKDYFVYSISRDLAFLDKFVEDVQAGRAFKVIRQDESKSIYWPRLATKIHGYIDWNWARRDVEGFICAFDDPYDGAITFLADKKVRVKKCVPVRDGPFHPFQNGLVYRVAKGKIFVAMKEGGLAVGNVTDEEGENITGRINLGDRLHTPISFCEKAKQFRAVYTPLGIKNK